MAYRLMIVDDERLIRQGLRKVIPWEELGFVVVSEANSGKTALEAAMHRGKEPQVILTDIRMPDMGGLELISRLRLRFPKLRSVVISGYSDFKYAVEAIKLKVEDYILKPIDPEIIKETFSRLHTVLDSEGDRENSGSHGGLAELAGILGERLEEGRDVKVLAASIAGKAGKTLRDPLPYYRQILGDLACRFQIVDFTLPPESETALPETLFLRGLDDLVSCIRVQSASMGKYLTIKMKRAVEDHYEESDFCLGKLAEILKVSYGYLSTIFSKYERIGFSAYLRHYRMEKARDLILGRDFKISEVALLVGYGNIHYFSDAFRREYGLSPRAYIIRMRGDGDGL
jgi:two-component system response regulator YesN